MRTTIDSAVLDQLLDAVDRLRDALLAAGATAPASTKSDARPFASEADRRPSRAKMLRDTENLWRLPGLGTAKGE